METFLIYLLKSAGLLTIFYLAYIVLLRKDTNFQGIRRFFLGGILASAVLPGIYFTRKVIVEANSFPLNEASINTSAPLEIAPTYGIWDILGIVYILVTLFFLVKILIQLFNIQILIKRSHIRKNEGFNFLKTDASVCPFSFFKFIVYNPAAHSEKDLRMILQHEKTHAAQWHSIDILIANLTTALLWFNPLSWFYKKSLEQNLEYIADRETVVISGAKKSYQQALVKVSIANLQPALTNHFYQSFIKKRILMLNKNSNQNSGLWKTSLVFPLILAFMLAFNVKTQASINSSENSKTLNVKSEVNQKVLEAHFSENTSKADLQKHKEAFAKENVKLEWRDLKYSANKLKNIHITYALETGATQEFQSEINKEGEMLAFKIAAKFHENGKDAFIAIANKKANAPTTSQLVEHKVESLENKKLPENLIYKINGKTASAKDVESLKPKNIAKMQVLKGEKAINEAGKKAGNGVILITTKIPKKPNKIPGDPLYILNGEKSKKEIIELLDKDLIKSVNILKGESATSLYGEEAKEGAIIITTKVSDKAKLEVNPSEKVIYSYSSEEKNPYILSKDPELMNAFYASDEKMAPLVIIDGTTKNGATIKNIDPKNIESINVLKGDGAIKKYGKEAHYGAIEVTTKTVKN